MNGVEFFEKTLGGPANEVLHSNHETPGDKVKRLTIGVAMVVKEDRVVMNKDYGFAADVVDKTSRELLREEILEGLGEPTILLLFTQALVDPLDLTVTYDPRRARLISPGGVITFDATKLRRGDFEDGSSEARVAKLTSIRKEKKS